MERVLAAALSEASSYISNAWSGSGSNKSEYADSVKGKDESKERTTTGDSSISGTSCASSSSKLSTSSTSSKKFGRVFAWVYGSSSSSKKNKNKNSTSSPAVVYDISETHAVTNKKTALDVLLATASNNHEIVKPDGLKAISVIGRGGYGRVFLMKCQETKKLVAVKEVPKSNLIDKPGATRSVRPVSTKIERAEIESMVLHTVGEHPFITSFHGSYQSYDKLFFMLEFAPGGELFTHMQRQGIFAESRVQLYVAEIVLVLEFLHQHGIVYRDLKPENILLDKQGHIRITDFGLSVQFNKHGDDNNMRCYSICGTPEYISPELISLALHRKNDRHATYGKTVDWWSLGVLTYEMLYRVPPFYHRDRKTMLNKILECDLKFPTPTPKMKAASPQAHDFISSLLKFNEEDRLGYGNDGSANIKAHSFFEGLDFAKVQRKEYQPIFVPDLKDDVDVCNFDPTFTKELLREDRSSASPYCLELNGFSNLPEKFSECIWFEGAGEAQVEEGREEAVQVQQEEKLAAAAAAAAAAAVVDNDDDAGNQPKQAEQQQQVSSTAQDATSEKATN